MPIHAKEGRSALAKRIDQERARAEWNKHNYPQKKGYIWVPGVKCSSGARFGYFRKLTTLERPINELGEWIDER